MKKKILIADDEQEIVSILTEFFKREGYSVFSANNGDIALNLIWSELPDLIILDIMMPGKNGFEIAEMLQDDPKTQKIPVLMLSARSDDRDEALGYRLGATYYMKKPFTMVMLNEKIREILG